MFQLSITCCKVAVRCPTDALRCHASVVLLPSVSFSIRTCAQHRSPTHCYSSSPSLISNVSLVLCMRVLCCVFSGGLLNSEKCSTLCCWSILATVQHAWGIHYDLKVSRSIHFLWGKKTSRMETTTPLHHIRGK